MAGRGKNGSFVSDQAFVIKQQDRKKLDVTALLVYNIKD